MPCLSGFVLCLDCDATSALTIIFSTRVDVKEQHDSNEPARRHHSVWKESKYVDPVSPIKYFTLFHCYFHDHLNKLKKVSDND